MNSNFCFKVCRRLNDGHFWSSQLVHPVKYELGKETTAPVGGLLVFDTIERAFEYWPNGFILFGRGKDIIELPKYRIDNIYEYSTQTILKRCWEDNDLTCNEAAAWPLGTKAVRSFTPIAVVFDPINYDYRKLMSEYYNV